MSKEPVEAGLEGVDHEAAHRRVESLRGYLTAVASSLKGAELQAREGTSDLVQETIFSAIKSINEGRGPDDSEADFKRWLRAILKNVHQDMRRHHLAQVRSPRREDHGMTLVEPADRDRSPSSHAAVAEEVAILEEARKQLEPRDRLYLDLRHKRGLRFEAIAAELGISTAAAHKGYKKAAERLRALCQDRLPGSAD